MAVWEKPLKKTIFTLNIGNNYAPEITAITYPLMRHYARKIGAFFHVITERKFPAWPLTYEKFQIYRLAQEMENDWNIYIDSDAIIHPDLMDITNHLPLDTVAHNGSDVADNRWKYDRYFLRDGRHIGSCNWFTAASHLCIDLWRPLDDLTLDEALANIYPSRPELNGIITPEHLIDDYVCSRNIAKYGLKFTTFTKILQDVGYANPLFLYHTYNVPEQQKKDMLNGMLQSWGVIKTTYSDGTPLPDIPGWMTREEVIWLHKEAAKVQSVVEIGSWLGRSTHALLTACKGPVWAIDHWQGSPSERETTHRLASEADVYQMFLNNVGHFGNLKALKMDSVAAAAMFDRKSIEMVFIDGDHGYEAVKADVQAWLPACKKVLCGHDLFQGGVKQALDDLMIPYRHVAGTSMWIYELEGTNE